MLQVLESKGNNLHLVEEESGHKTLCSMPPKFRKNVWIKRGEYRQFDVLLYCLASLFLHANSWSLLIRKSVTVDTPVSYVIVLKYLWLNILANWEIRYG